MADRALVVSTINIDGEDYRLMSCYLTEPLNEVPSALVEITALTKEGRTPAVSAVIDKVAKLHLKRDDGKGERYFHGKVVDAERFRPEDAGEASLRLRIVPKLWRATKRADCRTYQEKKVEDILKDVLDKAGVDKHRFELKGEYLPRKYVVQYRETDLDFILRVCSQEGIYFAVEHTESDDTVVFGDDGTGFGDIEGEKNVAFTHAMGHAPMPDRVYAIQERNVVKSDKVFVRDYNYKKPKLKLEDKAEGKDDGAHALEVYLYPARFNRAALAKKRAQTLIEQLQAERRVVTGEISSTSLKPGYRFTLEEHPYAPLNQEYLVIGLDSIVEQARHDSAGNRTVFRFTAVPTKKNAYRPARRQYERTVPGLQTAWTVGPAGSEIDVDKRMRVKVQFHWDRLGKNDEKSSKYMRTQQPHSGGAMYIPRCKWEVSVAYWEGDVDRPLVMQRWYNAVNMPPYKLPDHKARTSIQTNTTPGGGSSNEIRFDDTKGKEEMFMNGSKDMSVKVGNNTTQAVGGNETRDIGSNRTLNVTNSVTTAVTGNHSTTVGANQTVSVSTFNVDDIGGNHTKSIGAARNMKIGGDHKRTVSGNSTLTVGASQIDMVVGAVSEDTPAAFTHNVGAAHVDLTVKDRSVLVGGARTENVAAAKVVVAFGGRGVEVKGMFSQKVGGAILNKIDGDRSDKSAAMFTEIAAGATILKIAGDCTYEAESLITLVMGASILMVTPASVMVLGTSAKLDGATIDTAALVLDN